MHCMPGSCAKTGRGCPECLAIAILIVTQSAWIAFRQYALEEDGALEETLALQQAVWLLLDLFCHST